MKHIQKLLLLPLLLCAISNTIRGYELFFSNFTNIPLIICAKKRAGIVEKYYQIVPPGGSVIQPWDDANCLESLQWTELNTNLPLQGGKALADPNEAYQIPRNKQKVFDETFFDKKTGKGLYAWCPLPIVMVPNATFKATRDAATKLVQGFEKPLCWITEDLTLQKLESTLQAAETSLNNLVKANAPEAAQAPLKSMITSIKKKISEYPADKRRQSTDKNECMGFLGRMTNGAGKLSGISICAHRQFAIYDLGVIDKITGKPYLIAATGEGE